jgi:hypothetical protein
MMMMMMMKMMMMMIIIKRVKLLPKLLSTEGSC